MIIAVNNNTNTQPEQPVTTEEQSAPTVVTSADTGNVSEQRTVTLTNEFTACRVGFHWYGLRTSLTDDQKSTAAASFKAKKKSISASKKKIDPNKHKEYRDLTSLKGEMQKYWQRNSLPYPEDGIRLIRISKINDFVERMESYQGEIRGATLKLDQVRTEIVNEARKDLGDLFSEGDYPQTFQNEFSVQWDFPSLTPPAHLDPNIYEAEMQKIRARISEAGEMMEEAFMAEFAKTVDKLVNSLNGLEDGTVKRFHDSNVTNLTSFFENFENLNVGCSEDLENLISQAKNAVAGKTVDELKTGSDVRKGVAETMGNIFSQLEDMMESAPARVFG